MRRYGGSTAIVSAVTLAVAAGLAPPARAQEALLTKYGCLACHRVDAKLVGPAYKEVAAKYRGQPDAAAALYTKVRRGGAGVWGSVPMPPNPTVSDADLKAMVKFILSQ